MSRHVFTYGSLMFPDVWVPLVPRPRASVLATLPGFAREGVRGQTYPGIRLDPRAQTSGRLYLELDDDEIARLDAFEGSEYRRETVTVWITTADGRATSLAAEVYRLADPAQLDGQPWDPEAFARTSARGFYREHASGAR